MDDIISLIYFIKYATIKEIKVKVLIVKLLRPIASVLTNQFQISALGYGVLIEFS
jgi:hypothetical protein